MNKVETKVKDGKKYVFTVFPNGTSTMGVYPVILPTCTMLKKKAKKD